MLEFNTEQKDKEVKEIKGIDLSFVILLGNETMYVNNNKDDTMLTTAASLFTSSVFAIARAISRLGPTLAKSKSIRSYS